MGKNIKVEALEPFSFKEDIHTVYPKTYKMWVDRETFERLNKQNLVKIIEIKREVQLNDRPRANRNVKNTSS